TDEAATDEVATPDPFVQHQVESMQFLWNDVVDLLDWRKFPEHVNSWEGRLLYGMGKLADAIGPDGFLRIFLGVALWAATVALLGPIMAWPLTDPALRAAACIKFVIGLYALPVLLALLTRPEGMEIFCGKGCPRGKVLLLKLAGAATGFFAFAGVNVFASLAVFYLIGRTPPTWLIALLCLTPPLFAFAAARRIPLDRHYMFRHGIQLHEADWWVLMAALVFAPLLAFLIYMFQWMLADRVTGASVLLTALIFVAWNERRRSRRKLLKTQSGEL
ncbi:MAG: hypothetical protein KDD84_14705, partial [Caldilineaceae bacterium]|nr:hypothetical protein [Caldilineaceae bacterium]